MTTKVMANGAGREGSSKSNWFRTVLSQRSRDRGGKGLCFDYFWHYLFSGQRANLFEATRRQLAGGSGIERDRRRRLAISCSKVDVAAATDAD